MPGKKEKAAPNVASVAKSVSEMEEESNTLSPPTKKKKSELRETTATDAKHVKEALKVKIRGGSSRDALVPPLPLHPNIRVKKNSTM